MGNSVIDHLDDWQDVAVHPRDRRLRQLGRVGRQPQLPGAHEVEEEPAAAAVRTLDARPAGAELRRHRRVRPGRGARHAGNPDALVRPLAEGRGERRRGRSVGARLRDGRRRRTSHARGPHLRRRPLARRAGLAAAERGRDAALSARRRRTLPRAARHGRADQLPLRSAPSGPDAGRQCFLAARPDAVGGAEPGLSTRISGRARTTGRSPSVPTCWCSRPSRSPRRCRSSGR